LLLWEVISGDIESRREKKYWDNCTIGPCGWHKLQITPCVINMNLEILVGPCGWHKLQITPCVINMNLEILVVGLIYKSIPEVKFH
jgi:hypothetical protein